MNHVEYKNRGLVPDVKLTRGKKRAIIGKLKKFPRFRHCNDWIFDGGNPNMTKGCPYFSGYDPFDFVMDIYYDDWSGDECAFCSFYRDALNHEVIGSLGFFPYSGGKVARIKMPVNCPLKELGIIRKKKKFELRKKLGFKSKIDDIETKGTVMTNCGNTNCGNTINVVISDSVLNRSNVASEIINKIKEGMNNE